MILKKFIKNIHLSLSKDLGEALDTSCRDNGYIKLIFTAQLTSVGTLFVTEDATAHLILIYILIPLLFLPLRFEEKALRGFRVPIPVKISFYNIFRNALLCRTPLFLAVAIYGSDKAFLSYLYPEPVLGYLHIFFYYLLAPLLAFMIATIRLTVDMPNFYFLFFRLAGPIVALNAAINIYLFTKKISGISQLGTLRLTSSFGSAMGYNANLDALIYAVFFIGLVITVISSRSKYDLALSIPTIIILFSAILLEQSRATSIGAIISFFYFAIFWKSKISLRVICGAISGLCFILVFVYGFLPDGLNTYLSQHDNLRPELWQKFFNLSKEHAFSGLGDRLIFAVPLSDGQLAPHPHSILLSSLLRGGLIGLLMMLFILLSGLLRAYQYAHKTHNAVPFCIFLSVTIAGLFDFDLKVWQAGWYLAGYWLAIALALGADAALRNKERVAHCN